MNPNARLLAAVIAADSTVAGPSYIAVNCILWKEIVDAVAAVKAVPALLPFDDNDRDLWPGAENLENGRPPEVGYRDAGADSFHVIVAGPSMGDPRRTMVSVYDEQPDQVLVKTFDLEEHAVAFANFLLSGALPLSAIRSLA